jgi:hypothetical protein
VYILLEKTITYIMSHLSVTAICTDDNKLESIQWQFANLCYKCFFPHTHYSYVNISEYLKLHNLIDRINHINKIVFCQIFNWPKICPSQSGRKRFRILQGKSVSPLISGSVFYVKMFLLLCTHQFQILFAVKIIYIIGDLNQLVYIYVH